MKTKKSETFKPGISEKSNSREIDGINHTKWRERMIEAIGLYYAPNGTLINSDGSSGEDMFDAIRQELNSLLTEVIAELEDMYKENVNYETDCDGGTISTSPNPDAKHYNEAITDILSLLKQKQEEL